MKKSMLIAVTVISILMMLFSTAAAPAPRSITLDSFIYIPGKGFVGIFNIKGEWKSGDIWGFVTTRHDQLELDCNFRDDGKVSCVASGGIAQYQGKIVKLVVYGYAFDALVPNK